MPIVSDVYLNVLSSALYDAIGAAFSRQGKADSEATFSFVKTNEEGQMLGEVSGRTTDPEMIKELLSRLADEDEPGSA
jgi:hypothetical protein